MSKQSRRGRPHTNGKSEVNGPGASPVERAIDAASESPQPEPRTDAVLRDFMVAVEPVQLAGKSKIQLVAPAEAARTMIMIHDPAGQKWIPILLPPNSRYVLQPDAAPEPQLWLPPGAKK